MCWYPWLPIIIVLPAILERQWGFHAHNQVCLDIYALFGFFGGVLKVPVLFNLSKEVIFHETAVIITIKSYEGITYVYICHEHDLFLKGRRFIVPFFDNYCI